MGLADSLTLRTAIAGHRTSYPEEHAFIDRFLDLLTDARCFQRDHLPGHITGSAWILDESANHVVLVHHRKLGRWLQPGGHADGETDIAQVALREAQEETGLKPELMKAEPWDIDIHRIPARKDFPEHDHYDIRYLMRAPLSAALRISTESTDLRWFRLDELRNFTNSTSVIRMGKKSGQLQNQLWH